MTRGDSPRWFLWPLALLYEAAVRLRERLYSMGLLRSRRLDGVVISVGNLTVGGTGKTPMVLWLAQHLQAEGKRCGILTRGYRGEISPQGPTSDEVRLLQARLGPEGALGVGADRYACGRELAARGIGWFVLDDGFQHWRLARDVDIVLVDATDPLGGGRLLPAGRLREPCSALRRADIIVITRSRSAPAVEAVLRRYSDAPIFYAHTHLDALVPCKKESASGRSPSPGEGKWFAFCGIGNPPAFFADLRAWGFAVVGSKVFADHHRYTPRDVDAILRQAHSALPSEAAAIVCTEKDLFNFDSTDWGDADLYYCRISLELDREEDFTRTIAALLESRRSMRKSN